MCIVNFRARLAQRIYDFLDVGKSPHIADCIVVMAGMQERKTYGVKMWRFGYAAQLILSVGRFEWRKFVDLNLESDGGLTAMVEKIPAKKRHFLVRMDRQDTCCTAVRKGLLGTRTEARAIAEYLRPLSVRTILVVSSPQHLRRAALAFRKCRVRATFVAVPEKISFIDPASRASIWKEFLKYLFYRLMIF